METLEPPNEITKMLATVTLQEGNMINYHDYGVLSVQCTLVYHRLTSYHDH